MWPCSCAGWVGFQWALRELIDGQVVGIEHSLWGCCLHEWSQLRQSVGQGGKETLSWVVSAQLRWKGWGLLTWAVPLAHHRHLVVCLWVLWVVMWPHQQLVFIIVICYSPGHRPLLMVDVSGVCGWF